MTMVKVWNISDHPETDVEACTVMVLGRIISPGKYVLVDETRLEKAHKLVRDANRRLLHIGNDLPADYRQAKMVVHAVMPKGCLRARGPVSEVVPVEPTAEVVVETSVEPTDSVSVTLERSDDDTYDLHAGKRRGRK